MREVDAQRRVGRQHVAQCRDISWDQLIEGEVQHQVTSRGEGQSINLTQQFTADFTTAGGGTAGQNCM